MGHCYYIFSHTHRGESVTVQKGKLSASAWLDRKMVTVMATNCQPSDNGAVLQGTQDGSRITVPCPTSIILYNNYMGGVDRGDQLRGYYRCRTKSRKFYKYIFYFLLDVAITNAFILMKNHTTKGSKMTIKDFRLQLASQLIGDYCSHHRRGRTSSSIRPLPLRHFPVKVDDDSSSTKRKRSICALCRQRTAERTQAGTAESVLHGSVTQEILTIAFCFGTQTYTICNIPKK